MDRIVRGFAALLQLAHPGLGIIVDPDQSRALCGKACMVEQREISEPELGGSIANERGQLRQVPAGLRRFSETVA